MPELAYVNGTFGPIEQATVSIEDRGFQFGDGIYEVVVAYGGRLFLLDRHMRRLRRSVAAVGIEYDFDSHPIEPIIEEGLRRSELENTMVYIQLTRGVAPREHAVLTKLTPTLVMTFKPLHDVPATVRRSGVSLMTTLDQRWSQCYVKAVTLLPNIMAKTEALRQGYYDAIFVTESQEVRECTSANIFIAKDGRLKFPPRTKSVLHGITQSFILDCAAGVDIPVDEQAFHKDELMAADEVFMSGTTVEALGVVSVDGQPIGKGAVGPLTTRLFEAFRQRIGDRTTHAI